MGQITLGILYGVEAPEGVVLLAEDREDGCEDDGLLDAWERACGGPIGRLQERFTAGVLAGKRRQWGADASTRYIPDIEYTAGARLLGFWVAVGATGKSGVPRLSHTPLLISPRSFREEYPRGYAHARRRWRRFARWAVARGVTLPRARMWLVETDVA